MSTIHAPASLKSPRLRSALDYIALIAVVLALGLAALFAGVRPNLGSAPIVAVQGAGR